MLELSMVLLVITLFMGVTLNSSSVVDEARIKRLALDVVLVRGAVQGYVEQYHLLPGDDPLATQRWRATQNGNGDGVVEGVPFLADPMGVETGRFWSHLRLSGRYVGVGGREGAPGYQGGRGRMGVGVGVMGFSGLAVCFSGVPHELLLAYDAELDDGVAEAGIVRWGEVSGVGLAVCSPL